ncbi:MAG: hypothetical protein A2W26_11910 [Acidobacteria bacterium RBG_16_64_8]|nr:MAG: hypothetical protein A2W26_11910 [Acidobacteria bacterium RBG_16_64_8]
MKAYLVAGVHPTIPAASGIRSYVLSLASRLASRGVAVVLIGVGPPAPVAFGEFRSVVATYPTSSYRFLRGLWRYARQCPVEEGAIVHAQRPDDLYPFLGMARGARLICTLHGDPGRGVRERRVLGRYLYGMAERRTLPAARRVISVTESGLRAYVARYPWLESKTSVIPVGVDLAAFRPSDRGAAKAAFGLHDRPTILFAGRFEPEKRVEVVIEAIRGLTQPPDLLLAGQGRLDSRMRALAGGLPVRFLGPVDRIRMPVLLSAVDALVLASSHEGLPTIVLESLACGTPVIATRVGDLSRVLEEGKTGFYFDGSPGALRDLLAMRWDSLLAMRSACARSAEPYSWDRVADRVMEVYDAAL